MRLIKPLGLAGALVLSAFVGGTLIGSAFALDEGTETDTPGARAEYCEVFIEALAGELGVTRDELSAAEQTAAGATIDAAVEAGDLSEDHAARLRERITDADEVGCGLLRHGFARGFGHGVGHGMGRGFLGGDVLEAAADALGIDSSDLIGELRDAGSLQEVAEARGTPYAEVADAILESVRADLDAAVADGLPQDRADAALERLGTWLDNGGQLEGLGHGRPSHGPWGVHPHDAEGGDSSS